MSSTPYSTEIAPERQLRLLVIASGVASMLVGMPILVAIDMDQRWTFLAGCIWLIASSRQLIVITFGYKRYRRLRIYGSGDAELQNRDGDWRPAKLLPGSIVLDKLAWLRFVAPDGSQHREFVRRRSAECEAWRRLQVIWRHLGASR